MNLRIITPPTAEPMTLEEALHHLNVSLGDQHLDAWLTSAITQAREKAEDELETCLTDAVYEFQVDSFHPHQRYDHANTSYVWHRGGFRLPHNCHAIELPIGDIGRVASVTYIDANGDQQTLDPTLYVFDGNQRTPIIWRAYGQSWPSTRCQQGAVTVTFQGRYTETGSPQVHVPEVVKGAMKLMLSTWNEDREGATDMPPGAMSLLGKRRLGMGV